MPLMPCAPAVPWREVESMERRTIGEITVYTVAAEESADPSTYDFADLESALSFAETVDCVGGGAVALDLADGTHYFRRNPAQPDVFNNGVAAYNLNHAHLFLGGSGRDACRIAFDPSITVERGTLMRLGNAKFALTGLSVDLSNPDANPVYGIRSHNSYVTLYDVEFSGAGKSSWAPGIWDDGESLISARSSTIRDFYIGVFSFSGAASGVVYTIEECTIGVWLYMAMGEVKVTNNLADTPVYYGASANPMEILPGGGVVSDGSGTPPTLAGWTGATADRPTLPGRAYATPYLDTDLGYPIWWVGDKWVDATGTEV